MKLKFQPRSGVVSVESAVVIPVVFLLMIGMMVGAIGIFRYQQMASLARRAARYAVVHGQQYSTDTRTTAATPTDIYNTAIKPNAVSLDLSKITYSVTYNTDNRPYHTTTINGTVVAVANIVTVQLNYRWIPEIFFGGMTLTSTSSMPMSY